jgi:hypothetical protein
MLLRRLIVFSGFQLEPDQSRREKKLLEIFLLYSSSVSWPENIQFFAISKCAGNVKSLPS